MPDRLILFVLYGQGTGIMPDLEDIGNRRV